MGKKRLFLIDATAFCYRAFYALTGLATSFGQPTNAVYGFINMLSKVLKESRPEFLAACFDVSRETFRTKKFAEYKIQRPPMPDALSSQIPLIKEIISAWGIKILEKEGFEADDVIATFCKKAAQQGLAVTVISSDKDILQLVNDDTVVFSPYKDKGTLYDKNKVFERFGVGPDKIPDLIALMGDGADNIPSVPGIGEKTAAELVSEFGSVNELLKQREKIKKQSIRRSIEEHIDTIELNMELAKLREDVDLEFGLDSLKLGEPDYKELTRIFKRLEFKKLLRELPVEENKETSICVEDFSDAALKSLNDEVFIVWDLSSDMLLANKEKCFRVSLVNPKVKALLEDPSVKKIGHDLKKIKFALAAHEIRLEGLHFDSLIGAYLLNPSKPEYGLTDIAWDHLGESFDSGATSDEARMELLLKLKPRLELELQEKALISLFSDLEMPLVEVLAQMELNGISLDIRLMHELSAQIEKRLIQLIENIYEQSGTQFNINSPKQLREILFEKLKLPVIRRSKTGPSTNEEVLRALADKHKLPAMLLEYRQLTKLKNTYIDTLPQLVDKKTGRIHASFNQAATETGRLSSSNPNLQNIPVKTDIGKNIRRAIVAKDGNCILLSCDYSQIELRILAHLCQDAHLISEFQKDHDIHKAAAALIYGLNENDITDQMREVAKRVNFGIVYGLTSYGLSRDLSISVDEAQGFIDAYFARYPGVKEYIDSQIRIAKKEGFVTTLLGRRRYIPEINNKNQGIRQFAERQAVNTPIQGSASDLIKLAMVDISRKLKTRGLASKMIMQIHDELVFEVPNQESNEVAKLVKDRMENCIALDVPIKVDMKKGANWLEMEDLL